MVVDAGIISSLQFSSIIEPPHDKANKMVCAPNKDSDQPGHPPSLIRVFTVHMKKPWVYLSYPLSAWRTLIRLGRCPGWSESLLGAQVTLLVLSWGGSIILCFYSLFLSTTFMIKLYCFFIHIVLRCHRSGALQISSWKHLRVKMTSPILHLYSKKQDWWGIVKKSKMHVTGFQ